MAQLSVKNVPFFCITYVFGNCPEISLKYLVFSHLQRLKYRLKLLSTWNFVTFINQNSLWFVWFKVWQSLSHQLSILSREFLLGKCGRPHLCWFTEGIPSHISSSVFICAFWSKRKFDIKVYSKNPKIARGFVFSKNGSWYQHFWISSDKANVQLTWLISHICSEIRRRNCAGCWHFLAVLIRLPFPR